MKSFSEMNLGMLLLSIWLVVSGILGLLGKGGRGVGTFLAILALVAGILLFIEYRGAFLRTGNLGILFLALWLLLSGLLSLLHAGFAGQATVLALLALCAGILLLLHR